MAGVVRKISTKLEIDGEKEFKSALSEVNKEMSEPSSRMQLSESEFASNENHIDALRAKSEVLEEQISALSDKQKAYTEQLGRVRARRYPQANTARR